MKKHFIAYLLGTLTFYFACKNEKEVSEEEIVTETVFTTFPEEEDVVPPPPGFKSRFDDIPAWLNNICTTDNPDKDIETYRFGLFEGEGEYTLFVTGYNTYRTKEKTEIRIDFRPKEMYCLLSKHLHKGLNNLQVKNMLDAKLKEFVESQTFKSSFFSKAKCIRTDWNGKILWGRQGCDIISEYN